MTKTALQKIKLLLLCQFLQQETDERQPYIPGLVVPIWGQNGPYRTPRRGGGRQTLSFQSAVF